MTNGNLGENVTVISEKQPEEEVRGLEEKKRRAIKGEDLEAAIQDLELSDDVLRIDPDLVIEWMDQSSEVDSENE